MSGEIASAFVSMVPSARGFGKELNSQISGEVKSSGSKMGGLLGKGLKAGALGVAGAAGAVIGTALFKGFGRLQGIDQAEAKLKGLGHTTKGVDKIMENALASVKGTAFGLDEAATSAAGAVAAGVKPGKELERNLSLVGDAATIAGTDMGTMGSIFNKVAASDMIQGDVLAQLGDAGIPVLQMLGKEMGVSATEVRKLASEGKINFATFQNAMEGGLGGAAQESGKTFSGSMANMQAALGRLGANLLGGVFAKMPALFGSVTTGLDKLGPVATRVGEAIGAGFSAIVPIVAKVRDYFSGGGGAGLMGGLQSLAATVQANALPALHAMANIFTTSILPAIMALAATVQANVLPVLQTMANTFMTSILPAVMALGGWLLANLVPVFTQIWGIVSTKVLPIVSSLAQFFYGTLYPALVSIATAVASNLKPVFDQLVTTFQSKVLPTVSKLLDKFEEWRPTIQRVITVVVKLVGAVLKFAAAILGKVLPPVIRFSGFLLSKLVPAVAAVIGVVVKVIGKVVDFGVSAFNAGRKVAEFAQKVIDKITGLKDKVVGALEDAGEWLKDAGEDIVKGLGAGIEAAKEWLKEKAEAVAGWIPGWIKKRLGIASPSKVTMALGMEVARGLGAGIENGRGKVDKSVKKMLNALAGGKGKGWMETVAKGIKLSTPKAVKAAQDAFEKLTSAVKTKRDNLKSTLDGLKGEFESLADSVSSAFAGNLFSVSAIEADDAAGTAGKTVGQSFIDNLMGKKAELTSLLASFKTLAGWGLDPAFLSQLFASGNGALITELAGMGKEGAIGAATLFGEVTSLGDQLGNAVAKNDPVSDRIDETNKQLGLVNKQLSYLASEIGKELNGAAAKARRHKTKKGKK